MPSMNSAAAAAGSSGGARQIEGNRARSRHDRACPRHKPPRVAGSAGLAAASGWGFSFSPPSLSVLRLRGRVGLFRVDVLRGAGADHDEPIGGESGRREDIEGGRGLALEFRRRGRFPDQGLAVRADEAKGRRPERQILGLKDDQGLRAFRLAAGAFRCAREAAFARSRERGRRIRFSWTETSVPLYARSCSAPPCNESMSSKMSLDNFAEGMLQISEGERILFDHAAPPNRDALEAGFINNSRLGDVIRSQDRDFGHGAKSLLDLIDEDMLQPIDLANFLVDRMGPFHRDVRSCVEIDAAASIWPAAWCLAAPRRPRLSASSPNDACPRPVLRRPGLPSALITRAPLPLPRRPGPVKWNCHFLFRSCSAKRCSARGKQGKIRPLVPDVSPLGGNIVVCARVSSRGWLPLPPRSEGRVPIVRSRFSGLPTCLPTWMQGPCRPAGVAQPGRWRCGPSSGRWRSPHNRTLDGTLRCRRERLRIQWDWKVYRYQIYHNFFIRTFICVLSPSRLRRTG